MMDFEYKFAVRGLPRDYVSERILEKDQLEAEILPFWQTYLYSKRQVYSINVINNIGGS